MEDNFILYLTNNFDPCYQDLRSLGLPKTSTDIYLEVQIGDILEK